MTLATFTGCEKIINVDLNEAAPRIVIEGLVTDGRGPYRITITKSGSYFNQPSVETVSGAKVVITDDLGNIDSLHETFPGYLSYREIKGCETEDIHIKGNFR